MKWRDNGNVDTTKDVVASDEGRYAQSIPLLRVAPVNDDPKVQMSVIQTKDDLILGFFENRENIDATCSAWCIVQAVGFD